jgi:lipopolysaccharide transport system ATP-binding protein
MSTVIRVENLSKHYKLGTINHGVLFRDIQSAWARFRGKPDPNVRLDQQHRVNTDQKSFWALKDVSFDVKQGEVLGIIGRNGAGKSTLLKILSRVTAPTYGHIKLRGRIASLLEVGTGFHPELTGRDNIFLNGAILGMSKKEIQKNLDRITDFAGIEDFLDTPVKRYSSGMYVRLAFAVAAHLESEILIVDEVLAVGDAEFQKKCLGKMQEVSQGQGRTVLFVSHNMAVLQSLCESALLLQDGKIVTYAPTKTVIDAYLQDSYAGARAAEWKQEINPQKDFQLLEVTVAGGSNTWTKEVLDCDEDININLTINCRLNIPGLYGYMAIFRTDGTLIIENDSSDGGANPLEAVSIGISYFKITIPKRHLGVGKYIIYFNFASNQNFGGFNVESPGHTCSFELCDTTTKRGNTRGGFFSTALVWETCHKTMTNK